jgi:multimeric flavodoxin WrbA
VSPKPRIIAVNASPHRTGNTAFLLSLVLTGCREAGAAVELVNLADWKIGYCRGCEACLRTGRCAVRDRLPDLQRKIARAAGLIVASPVYEGHPSAQLKTLQDRLALFSLYYGNFDHLWTVGLATSGLAPSGGTAREATNCFGKRFATLGMRTATFGGVARPLEETISARRAARARRLGARLVRRTQGTARFSLANLKGAWIVFLRRHLIVKELRGDRERFAGVIRAWRRKGWYRSS